MREIKFRAWDGAVMHYNVQGLCLSHITIGSGTTLVNGIPMILRGDNIKWMQFTGEKDLWEDDIVRISRMEVNLSMSIIGVGQIVFDQARFYIKFSNGKCSNNLPDNNVEKLGNIHENPEILQGAI